MAEKKKAEYALPRSQVDLEARLESDNKSDRVLSTSDQYEPVEQGEARTFAVEGNDLNQYVGTSPEYATYANKTEAPLKSEGSAEAKVIEAFAASPVPATLKVDGNVEYEGEKASREAAAQSSDSDDSDASGEDDEEKKPTPPTA